MTLLLNKDQVQALPIQHLSVSAMRNFLTNEQDFFKKYIRLEFDNTTAPSLLVGKAAHSAMEKYWRLKKDNNTGSIGTLKSRILEHAQQQLLKEVAYAEERGLMDLNDTLPDIRASNFTNWDQLEGLAIQMIDLRIINDIEDEAERESLTQIEKVKHIKFLLKEKEGADIIENAAQKYIQWGKTGSLEDCQKKIDFCINNYFSDLPKYEPLYIEEKETVEFTDMEGNEMPVPLKGIMDLIARDENGDLVIVDHKFVAFHADPELDNAAFEMQAGAYFFIAQAVTGEIPKKMIFDEVIKSKAKVQCKADPARRLLEADLRQLCEEADIEWEKYDKNSDLQEKLLNAGILEYSQTRKPYIIDFEERPKVIDAFLNIYKAIVNRLAIVSLLEVGYEFLPNPFDRLTGKDSWEDYKETMNIGKNWKDAASKKEKETLKRPGTPKEIDFDELDF